VAFKFLLENFAKKFMTTITTADRSLKVTYNIKLPHKFNFFKIKI